MLLIKPKTQDVWQLKTFSNKLNATRTFEGLYKQGKFDFGEGKDIINFFKRQEGLELIKLTDLFGRTLYICPTLKQKLKPPYVPPRPEPDIILPPEYEEKIFWAHLISKASGGDNKGWNFMYKYPGDSIEKRVYSNNKNAIKKICLEKIGKVEFGDLHDFIRFCKANKYTIINKYNIDKIKELYPFPPPKIQAGNTKIFYAKLRTKGGTPMEGYYYIYMLPGRNYYDMAQSKNKESIMKSKEKHQEQKAGFGDINKFIEYCQSKGFTVVEVIEETYPPYYSPEEFIEPITTQPPIYYPPTEPQLQATKCFIATATYGTGMMNEINVLRNFRDQSLEPNFIGKKLINIYYSISPYIAKLIIKKEKLRAFTRFMLNPIVNVFKR